MTGGQDLRFTLEHVDKGPRDSMVARARDNTTDSGIAVFHRSLVADRPNVSFTRYFLFNALAMACTMAK